LDCGGKRSATPLFGRIITLKAWRIIHQSQSGVAAALCHRSPNVPTYLCVLVGISAHRRQSAVKDFCLPCVLLRQFISRGSCVLRFTSSGFATFSPSDAEKECLAEHGFYFIEPPRRFALR
jgi:hypothetical protein